MSNAKQQVHKRAPGQIAGMADRVTRLGESLEDFPSVEVDAALEKLVEAVQAIIHGRGTRPVPKEAPAPRTEDVPKAKRTKPVPDEKPTPRTKPVADTKRTKPVPKGRIHINAEAAADLEARRKAHKDREDWKAAKKVERKRRAEANKPKREAQKARQQILWAKQYDDAKGYLDIRKGDAVVNAAVITHTVGPHPYAGMKGLKDQEKFVLIARIGGVWTRIYMEFFVLDNGIIHPGETKPSGWTFVVARKRVIDPDLPRSIKELKKILHNNHPDTNPDADNGLFIRATSQLDLIRTARKTSRPA